jgi:hypothetical protein
MFNISTDASLKERREKYQKYGLLNKKGEFENPQEEWILHEFAKMNAPKDTTIQIRNQNKLLQDITNKIRFYKEKLREAIPLNPEEETEFELLKRRWEKEKEMEEAYLHPPGYIDKNPPKNVLFYELWEDLLKLKLELKKLK